MVVIFRFVETLSKRESTSENRTRQDVIVRTQSPTWLLSIPMLHKNESIFEFRNERDDEEMMCCRPWHVPKMISSNFQRNKSPTHTLVAQ